MADATSSKRWVLGSSSKWRAEVLGTLNVPFVQRSPDIDEKAIGDRSTDTPNEVSLAVANAKATALQKAMSAEEGMTNCWLITCDQVAVYQGAIREKPESEAQCLEFLQSYSGASVSTCAAVVLTDMATGTRFEGTDWATQHFADIPTAAMEALIKKGDVMYCCGGFLIDDPIIEPHLKEREGDYDSVLGFPIKLVRSLMDKAEKATL